MCCRADPAITEECFELLSLIAIASEDGAYKFCEPGVIDMIFLQISSLPDGITFCCLYLVANFISKLRSVRTDPKDADLSCHVLNLCICMGDFVILLLKCGLCLFNSVLASTYHSAPWVHE